MAGENRSICVPQPAPDNGYAREHVELLLSSYRRWLRRDLSPPLSACQSGSEAFVCLPSRKSAEIPDRRERARLLDAVYTQGFIDDYTGVRISASGRRFRIDKAVVWNLVDQEGVYRGQAACFDAWVFI